MPRLDRGASPERPSRLAVLETARPTLPTTMPRVLSSGSESVIAAPPARQSCRIRGRRTVALAADIADSGDDGFGEAELRLADVRDLETDPGIRDHRPDRGLVFGDRDVRLGDAGVPADVLEAFGEGEQEGVEHLGGQQHLAGPVPGDRETHPAEAVLDRLERPCRAPAPRPRWSRAGSCRTTAGFGVDPKRSWRSSLRVIGGLLAQRVRGDADARVREQGERGEHRVVEESRRLAALSLELGCLPFGPMSAADAGDALLDLGDARTDPDRDSAGEHPAQDEDADRAQRRFRRPGQEDRDAGDHDEGDDAGR